MVGKVMARRLEMPDSFSCLCVQGNGAVGEEIVAFSVSSVEVEGGGAQASVKDSAFYVQGVSAPGVDTAAALPAIRRPGIASEFARPRNGMESPALPAGSDVEGPNVARRAGTGAFARGESQEDQILIH